MNGIAIDSDGSPVYMDVYLNGRLLGKMKVSLRDIDYGVLVIDQILAKGVVTKEEIIQLSSVVNGASKNFLDLLSDAGVSGIPESGLPFGPDFRDCLLKLREDIDQGLRGHITYFNL